MSRDVDWDAYEMCLNDNRLPDSPACPRLTTLFLKLPGTTVISPTFFQHMPQLGVLYISSPRIVSLPPSISCLRSLEELFLRDCWPLMELPSEIGTLTKLKRCDFRGTKLVHLPEEMGNLTDLQHLIVSLSPYSDRYIKDTHVIPRMMISKLKKLKELRICVSSDAEWWEEEVGAIQQELCDLEELETLQWYLPTNKVWQQFLQLERNRLPIYGMLSDFTLTVGRLAQPLSGTKKKFEEFKNCLNWVNREGSMDDIIPIMESVEALFLSCHWTCGDLSTLNISKLKYLLLEECNKMKYLVEEVPDWERTLEECKPDWERTLEECNKMKYLVEEVSDGERTGFEMLEYLSIHHMQELKCIWKGPIGRQSFSKLKILALHTCPGLTTIFTTNIAQNLSSLAELIVENCPQVLSIFSYELKLIEGGLLFPCLEKIFLIDLPRLADVCGGLVLERLDTLLVFNCRIVKCLFEWELPHIKRIIGGSRWWNNLDCDKSLWSTIFVPLHQGGDMADRLFEVADSLQHFRDMSLRGYDEKLSNGTEKEKGKLHESKEAKEEEPLAGMGYLDRQSALTQRAIERARRLARKHLVEVEGYY